MLLERMTTNQVSDYLLQDDRLLVPVGSTEQHGPRGVIGTDAMIAQKIAESAADKRKVVCAPCVAYGMSEHHLGFPGTFSVSPTTLIDLYASLLRSGYESGFRRVVIVNGHGGNTHCLHLACIEAAKSCPDLLVRVSEWFRDPGVEDYIRRQFGEADGIHAMPSELSIVLHLFDGLIGPDKQIPQPKYDLDVVLTQQILNSRYPDGSINADQSLANPDFGEKLFETCVRNLLDDLEDWQEGGRDCT